MNCKTKIIATIGPSSSSEEILKKLIQAGMNVARLNFSHGTYKDHEKVIKIIRALSKEMKKPVGILLDLQGPKIRTGSLENGEPVLLKRNNIIKITSKDIAGTSDIISTGYKTLAQDVKKGDAILLDDGLIELRVLSTSQEIITCKIISGGLLKERKGINLPGINVSAPSLTGKDKKDLIFGIKAGVDYFALSFVRSASDLIDIKSIIKKNSAEIPVIAKIEKPEAVDNIDEIIKIADGIMVARGDLGVELSPEKVPTIQKDIIKKSVLANKPVITATQMLETMSFNPIPTRAEASDVANAIFDGTDAVMLSGETASGKYPVRAVRMMKKIALETEKSLFMKYNIQYKQDPDDLISHAVAQSAVNILHELNAEALVSFSWSGKTSKLISKQRPSRPIFVFTPFQKMCNRLSLVWGLTPFLIKPVDNTKTLISMGEKILLEKKYVKKNDILIITTGLTRKSGSTNLVKIHTVGQEN